MNPQHPPAVRYDVAFPALVIEHLTLTDPTVVTEARRWATGRREAPASLDDLRTADLSAFAEQAMIVGAQAISCAGGVSEAYNLDGLVAEIGERAVNASEVAASLTSAAIEKAAASIDVATSTTRAAIAEAGAAANAALANTVDTTRKTLLDEINRHFGGENPELLTRLAPLLDTFGRTIDARAAAQTAELLATIAGQFDLATPSSPMAQHTRELQKQQQELTDILMRGQRDLQDKVVALSTAVQLAHASEKAAKATAARTTLKGGTFEAGVHLVMHDIAAGLGDGYTESGAVPGLIARSKKGDGVLEVESADVRVVLEMTDSQRVDWSGYLAGAEQNRGALASIGLVRTTEQLGGHTVRTLGPRRILLAFDPATDTPDLLRTVVQLMRLAAISAGRRQDVGEILTADEKLGEAIGLLTRLDAIKKASTSVRQGAAKIDGEADALQADLGRLLQQARTALAGVVVEAGDVAA